MPVPDVAIFFWTKNRTCKQRQILTFKIRSRTIFTLTHNLNPTDCTCVTFYIPAPHSDKIPFFQGEHFVRFLSHFSVDFHFVRHFWGWVLKPGTETNKTRRKLSGDYRKCTWKCRVVKYIFMFNFRLKTVNKIIMFQILSRFFVVFLFF